MSEEQAARAGDGKSATTEREALQKILMGFSILDDGPDDSDVAHANRLIADGLILGRAALAIAPGADAADAARYRWLRDAKAHDMTDMQLGELISNNAFDKLDACIDAAMSAGPGFQAPATAERGAA